MEAQGRLGAPGSQSGEELQAPCPAPPPPLGSKRPNFVRPGGRGQTDCRLGDWRCLLAQVGRGLQGARDAGRLGAGEGRGAGRAQSATRECARQSGSARPTDKPAGCQPWRSFRASLARLPRFLSVFPVLRLRLPPPHPRLSSSHLSPCQIGSGSEHTRAHGLIQTRLNLATISHYVSGGDTISPAQPRRHTPLSRPANGGEGGAVWKVGGSRVPSAPYPTPLVCLLL